MNPTYRRLACVLSTAMLVVMASAGRQASADDTEIFVAEPPPGTSTAANIMFIIDTSGSMVGGVLTQESWNPNTDFDGNCADDRIYWTTGNQGTPTCSGTNRTDQYITATNFLCQSSQATLASAGSVPVASGIQWRNSNNANQRRWEGLTSGRRTQVDCFADTQTSPASGQSSGDARYPTDGATGPYTATAQGAAWWTTNNRNNSYTFYTGNYLNYLNSGGTVTKTRLEIVQEVTIRTLDNLTNVNVGLTIFNFDQGGQIVVPIQPIATVRDTIKQEVSNLEPNGWTPLSETLFEVYNYWAGNAPTFANSSVSSMANGAFISPLMGETCGKNYNVLLTDGEPTQDTFINDIVDDLPGFEGTSTANTRVCSPNTRNPLDANGRCLDDLAKYMYTNDVYSGSDVNDTVTTYTVGFGEDVVGSATLDETARAGGGGTAFEAGDTASLTSAFDTIIREIISEDTSFTAPAVSVNAFNRTQNLNDLFITVFEPSPNLHWAGNLKKYTVRADGTIEDANGNEAVNEGTGFFSTGAQSYWSDSTDGLEVTLGGAAHEQPLPANRKLYTDLEALGGPWPADLDGVVGNQVSTENNLLIDTVLGMPAGSAAAEVDEMIQWVRGGNVDASLPDEPRFTMGDPLHARPVSVIYGGSPGNPDIEDAVVFTANNDGYLHAIDPNGEGTAEEGAELWSFIPSELLPRMAALREDEPSTDKGYGLDGNLVAYKLDINRDGIVDRGAGDRVLLYFGMGRGGYNYYAFDVTEKDDPKLLWRNGRDSEMIGLGQTWSTPVITKINVGSSGQDDSKLVMIVGGGYDITQDNVPYNVDNIGNRIFMLDAITGELLWHAGPTNVTNLGYDSAANFTHAKMTHSIPADIRVLDLTNDGFADRMYAADTGGQVWRFDIFNGNPAGSGSTSNGSTADSLVTGGVFASLGNAHLASHPTSSSRRFYNAPDISLIRVDGRFMINVALGSGYRGHPINAEIEDRFYSLRDKQPFQPSSQANYNSFVTITEAATGLDGLIDVTGVDVPTVGPNALGWKLLLNQPSWQGEKVLAESRTFNNRILFSTFTPVPSTNSDNSCVVSGVKNTFYAINALNGEIVVQNELQQTGIAPTPVILFLPPDDPDDPDEPGDPDDPPCTGDNCPPPPCEGAECTPPPVCLVGLENCGVDLTNAPVRTFWTQQNTDTN